MFKLAYFTPLKPQKTGVADYSEMLLDCIDKELFKIDIFSSFKSSKDITSKLKGNYDIFFYKKFPLLRRENNYDLVIYNMGNNYYYHDYIYEYALKYPGLVVLHDIKLGGFFCEKYLPNGEDENFLDEIQYGNGLEGLEAGRFILDKVKRGKELNLLYEYDYFFCNRIINESLGVVVNSPYALRIVKKINDRVPAFKLPQPIPEQSYYNINMKKEKILEDFNIKKDTFIISTLGFISEAKGVFDVIEVFKRLLKIKKDLVLVFVGQDMIGIKKKLNNDLSNKVVVTGFIDDHRFYQILAVSDIVINLRKYTAGETSGALIKAMFYGRPVIVSNIGSFGDIPIDTVLKVCNDSNIKEQLLYYLIKLINSGVLREKLGGNARSFILKNNNSERVSKIFSGIVKYMIKRKKSRNIRFDIGKNYGYERKRIIRLVNLNFHNVINNILSELNLSHSDKSLIYNEYNEFFLE